jgi:hypothetical protein
MIKYFVYDKDLEKVILSTEEEYKNYSWWRVEYLDGNNYHRLDGPAVETSIGAKWYYKNNLPHREDGSAFSFIRDQY